MCYISKASEFSRPRFLLNRITRVAPPYWIVTILMALLIARWPQVFNTSKFSPFHFAASLLFVAWPHPVKHEALPLYQLGWTLNYEMIFYCIFGSVVAKTLYRRVTMTTLILVVLVLAEAVLPKSWPIVTFYTGSIMLEFVLGMWLGIIYKRGFRCSPGTALFVCLSGCCLLFILNGLWPTGRLATMRWLIWGGPALLICAGGILLEGSRFVPQSTIFRALGDASYATYITHFFTLAGVGMIWKYIGMEGRLGDCVFLSACVLASLAGGIGFHLLIELPSIRLFRRWTIKDRVIPRQAYGT
jgi:exopolysaccharide production protein ExoZ